MGQQLGQYVEDTRDIIRDNLGLFVSDRQMTRYVNAARHQTAKVARCIKVLVPGQGPAGASALPGTAMPGGAAPGVETTSGFFTISGQESYPYSFANAYVQAGNAGVQGVLDVVQVAVSWSGASRPALEWLPWDDFQAYLRSYQSLMQSYPAVWSTLGEGKDSSVFLFPTPSVVTEMEWLVACDVLDLYTDDDYDAIPSPYDDAVKYYAAHRAYLSSQRLGQADVFLDKFRENIGVDRATSDGGKVSNYYYTY